MYRSPGPPNGPNPLAESLADAPTQVGEGGAIMNDCRDYGLADKAKVGAEFISTLR